MTYLAPDYRVRNGRPNQTGIHRASVHAALVGALRQPGTEHEIVTLPGLTFRLITFDRSRHMPVGATIFSDPDRGVAYVAALGAVVAKNISPFAPRCARALQIPLPAEIWWVLIVEPADQLCSLLHLRDVERMVCP